MVKANLFCELCDCYVGGLVNLEQHIGGKRHKTSIASALNLLEQQLGDSDEKCEVSEVFQVDTAHWKEIAPSLAAVVRKLHFSYLCPLCSYEATSVGVATAHMAGVAHREELKKNPKAKNILVLEKTR